MEDLLEQGVTNYFWSVSPSSKLQIVGSHINQNDVFVQALESGFAQINFHATNKCGTTVSTVYVIISRNCEGGGGGVTMQLVVFPNPATHHISVVAEQDMTIMKGFLVQNNTGVIEELKFQDFSTSTFSLDGKKEGVYHILILTAENELLGTKSFIINN